MSAEVYFRNVVGEMDRRRGGDGSVGGVSLGMGGSTGGGMGIGIAVGMPGGGGSGIGGGQGRRNTPGGVRIVNDEDSLEGNEFARDVLANVDTGRVTPTGGRSQVWGLGLRARTGSVD